mgnify:CR=1 FL=1
MSLLSSTFQAGGLLGDRRERFTRTRTTTTGKNADTGAPTTTTTTATVYGWHTWLSERERADFKDDTAAYILTKPNQLQAGDVLVHATLGRFVTLAGSLPNGEFERTNLRRA